MTGHGDMPVAEVGAGAGFWLLNVLVIAGGGYFFGVQRLRSRGDQWSRRRSLAATGGLLCVAAAGLPTPGLTAFPAHAVQHLLLAMLGPLLLALSAPVTLALRTLPPNGRRTLLKALHSRVATLLTLAPVVLILDLGGLYAYYLTPLYDVAHRESWLQALIHLHMFLAGCLLCWYLVGPDRIIRRPGIGAALCVLLIAATGHDVLAKLLYAKLLPSTGGTDTQIQLGAQLMYYGGSAVEVLLATTLMAAWYASSGRALRRQHRRDGARGVGEHTNKK
jgi:putative membrane protein